jgi:hypothetical protein
MHLVFEQIIDREIVHYADDELCVSSLSNRVYIEGMQKNVVAMPQKGFQSLLATSRLARRALRLDKCNVTKIGDDFVIIRQGRVYHYNLRNKTLSPTLNLKNCRNVLHQSIAVVDKQVFFGEYGSNPARNEVPIYRSQDGGESWEIIYCFPAGRIKHIHGCYWDPYEQKIWVFTGDFAGENFILVADLEFKHVEWIGDGTQAYRACNAFFEEDAVHWIMDSQLETSYHVRMTRHSRKIEKKDAFAGPVWYIKRLADGYYLAATTQEIGPGVKDRYAHLMVSRDLESWEDIHLFEHDGLPKRYFKFGVIGFSDGEQSSQGFYIFAEAIKGLDGKAALCHLVE